MLWKCITLAADEGFRHRPLDDLSRSGKRTKAFGGIAISALPSRLMPFIFLSLDDKPIHSRAENSGLIKSHQMEPPAKNPDKQEPPSDHISAAQVDILFEKGVALYQDGHLLEARDIFQKVIQAHPKHFDAVY